jgi:hypothetical protein
MTAKDALTFSARRQNNQFSETPAAEKLGMQASF